MGLVSLELMFQYLISPTFVSGAEMTLLITVVSLFFGLIAGLVLALVQEIRSSVTRLLAIVYLWVFRGTPVLFQIIFVYNVLPSFGIRLSAFVSAVLALSLNEGAYMAEILRSGLEAVRTGQRTAGLALGMTRAQVLAHVVIPQAARIVLPPMGNQMVGMLKTSALVSVIAVQDLLLVANQIASANFRYLEALTAAGIYYMILTAIFMGVQAAIERSLDVKHRRTRAAKPRALLAPLSALDEQR
jgi:polar amino acid transport system permease protein